LERAGGGGESAARAPSVQWCLGRLVQSSPTVTGEINGGRFNFGGHGRAERSVDR